VVSQDNCLLLVVVNIYIGLEDALSTSFENEV
jgi:hypothetical protein